MAGVCTRCNASGASTNNSGIPEPTAAVSCAPILAPACAPDLSGRYTDEEIQKTTKLALELLVKGQKHDQLQANAASRKQPLKSRFPDLYYRNSYLDYYCSCQQCKDHFKTVEANRPNQVLFVALFLCKTII